METYTNKCETNIKKGKKSNSADKEEERNFILRCIEFYRSMPVLWKVKSDEYMDRDKKAQALERLHQFYKDKFPNATADDVKNKFNSLRTNFRKELKKIKNSKKSGTGVDEVYESTLWYFDAMTFLVDQETPSNSINTIDDEYEDFTQDEQSCSRTQVADAPRAVTNIPILSAQKRKSQPKDSTDEFIRLACTRLQEPPDDDFHLATAWTRELRNMAPEQRIFAKKFINDIIFEGQLGTLNRNSVRFMNEQDTYDTSLSEPSNSIVPQLHTMISNPEFMSENSEHPLSHYYSSFQ